MSNKFKLNGNVARHLYKVLFALNGGFSVAFATVAYAYTVRYLTRPASYFLHPATYILSQYAERIEHVIPYFGLDYPGWEIALSVSVILIALVIFFILSLIEWTTPYSPIFYRVSGVAAFALVPLLYLHVLQCDWYWSRNALYPWRFGQFVLFVIEIPIVCGFFILTRNWVYQGRAGVVVLLLHYALWTQQMWWTFDRIPLTSPELLYVVFPCSGFAWLWYMRSQPSVEFGKKSG
jgi:hypothetical protein